MAKEIPLTQGKVAIVDDCFYEQLNARKWCAWKRCNTFYALRAATPSADGRTGTIRMHREVLNLAGIECSRIVDHRNRNGLDNRLENLRPASSAENGQNRGASANNTSGFKGVSWNKQFEKWYATVRVNGKNKFLGYFGTAELAAVAYDVAAAELYGEFAQTNEMLGLLAGPQRPAPKLSLRCEPNRFVR